MTKHIVLGILAILLAIATLQHHPTKKFTFEEVDAIAAKLSKPGEEIEERAGVPLSLSKLNYDQYRKLRWKDDYTLWRKEGLPFQLKFFHRGHINMDRVDVFAVTPNGIRPFDYKQQYFNYDDVKIPPLGDIGYAGFRIHYPINKPNYLDEVAVFLGASYFRAVPRDLQYGISARGLAINTGLDGKKEEFPRFRSFWIQQPGGLQNYIRMWALLEGESVSGAYEFEIYPGVETVMLVRAKIYLKKPVARLGVAPLTSMFWYGENSPDANRDWRPEVHDSDGLLIEKANSEWIWKPLTFGRAKRDNRYAEPGVKGFGLLQRDRDFSHYQDLEAKYSDRPSVWVEIRKGFENGTIELVQNATDNEFQDNVIAFWTPEVPPKVGVPMEFEYRIVWYGNHAERPPLGFVNQTFVEPSDGKLRYLIDFAGPGISNETQPPDPVIVTNPKCEISDLGVKRNEPDKTWRLTFTLAKPEQGKVVDIRALLSKENRPLTETWSYEGRF